MLRGVVGFRTPLNALLSKKFGKFVAGGPASEVRPEDPGV